MVYNSKRQQNFNFDYSIESIAIQAMTHRALAPLRLRPESSAKAKSTRIRYPVSNGRRRVFPEQLVPKDYVERPFSSSALTSKAALCRCGGLAPEYSCIDYGYAWYSRVLKVDGYTVSKWQRGVDTKTTVSLLQRTRFGDAGHKCETYVPCAQDQESFGYHLPGDNKVECYYDATATGGAESIATAPGAN